MKQAMLVLGMHRSGTSSVAGALAHLGASAPATLMPDHPDNPKGYWESLPLVHASDRILQSAGSSWSDWRPINPGWRKSVTGKAMAGDLPQLIAAEFGGRPLITFKDPRLCRLFPIWDGALKSSGYQPLVLTPLRSPIEVAASLSKRDGFSETRGLLLWLRHVLDAEAATRQTPRHFLYWSDFLNDWRAELSLATERLGASLPGWSDFTAEAVDTFLDVKLRRSVHDREIPSHAPEWIKLAWDAFKVLHQDPKSNSAQTTLDNIRAEFDRTVRIYGPALAGLEGERLNWNVELQTEVEALKSQLAVACHERDSQMMARADTEALLHTYMAKANELEQERDACRLEGEVITLRLTSLEDELKETISAQRQAETQVADLARQLLERDEADKQVALEMENLRSQASDQATNHASDLQSAHLTITSLEEEKQSLSDALAGLTQTLADLQSSCADHARTAQDLLSRLETSSARELQLLADIKVRDAQDAELRQSLTREREASTQAVAGLERELRAMQEAEAARLARNPMRRWLKSSPPEAKPDLGKAN